MTKSTVASDETQSSGKPDRITRWLLIAIGIYSALLVGFLNLVLGIAIWRQWPLSGSWVIGLFVGIDMIFNGWSLVMLGLAAKRIPAVEVTG